MQAKIVSKHDREEQNPDKVSFSALFDRLRESYEWVEHLPTAEPLALDSQPYPTQIGYVPHCEIQTVYSPDKRWERLLCTRLPRYRSTDLFHLVEGAKEDYRYSFDWWHVQPFPVYELFQDDQYLLIIRLTSMTRWSEEDRAHYRFALDQEEDDDGWYDLEDEERKRLEKENAEYDRPSAHILAFLDSLHDQYDGLRYQWVWDAAELRVIFPLGPRKIDDKPV